MDATTTATRDGWEIHYIDGMDLLSQARAQFEKSERHLEPLHKARIDRVKRRLDKLLKRATVVFDAVQSLR